MNRPLPLLLFFLLCVSITADSHPRKRDKRFEMRNKFYRVNYKADKGRNGTDGDARLLAFLNILGPHSGRNGKTGHTGPNLFGRVSAIRYGDSVILAIVVRKDNEKHTNCFYVNPRLGKVIIDADGGDGGDGGDGEGGRAVTEKHPYGSEGGNGGNGGNGGMGGTIDMTFDSTALAYVKCTCIVYFNRGGEGGNAGHGGQPTGGCSNSGTDGSYGARGLSGPPVYVKDLNGKIMHVANPDYHP